MPEMQKGMGEPRNATVFGHLANPAAPNPNDKSKMTPTLCVMVFGIHSNNGFGLS